MVAAMSATAVQPRRTRISAVFREFIRDYPRRFGLLFAILIVDGVVTAGTVLALVPLADFLLDPTLRAPSQITRALIRVVGSFGLRPSFVLFGAIFVGANVIKGALNLSSRYAVLRIKYTVLRGLFTSALKAFFGARWEFFSTAEQGRLMNTFNREITTISDTLGHLATQAATAVQLAIYLVVPMFLSARMTLTALLLVVALTSPLLLLQKLSYKLGQKNTATANVMTGVLTEMLGAARLILGFGRQRESRERFLHAFDQHVAVTLRSQTIEAASSVFFQPVAILAAVGAVGAALANGMPVAEMAALLWSLLRAFPLLGQLLTTNIAINSFLPSYEQLVALRSHAVALREVEGDIVYRSLERGIVLDGVDFTYPGRDETLRGISLSIPKGRMTALVGESGSGKSTITDLILGLQVPAKGDVELDGVPLRKMKQNSFRERVGYVPQDPLLFHASIRDNLLWSNPAASEDDLWRACRMANAESFVRDLPQGIDTIVGDRGSRLSGGQRQRIALARALARNPDLLILDEATSSLDSESEMLIQRAIDELAKDTTVLVIAHRLSTIARADRVYVVGGGRILESGTFDELSAKKDGVLARMIDSQRAIAEATPSNGAEVTATLIL